MKKWMCFLLIMAMISSLCACGEATPAETSGQSASLPGQTEPATPTTQPVALDPVGIYRITGLSTTGPDAYTQMEYGELSVYADGTGDIYFDDYYHDFTWEMEGDHFSAITTDDLNIPIAGTLKDGVMDLTYEEGVYLRFQIVTQAELAQMAVDSLRVWMVDTVEKMAVAYLGWYEGEQAFDTWLEETCPDMLAAYPFISGIPAERIIGEHGQVYCLVPKDDLFRLKISLLTEDGDMKEVLYEGNGEPVLLMCNYGAFYPDMQVVVTEEPSDELIFYPYLGSNQSVVLPTDEGMEPLVYDFTDYYEVCGDYYAAMLATGWSLPDEDYLASTCWSYYEDTQQERHWTLNLGIDGTVQLDLTVDGTEQTRYEGTWGLNWSDNDGLMWLYLNITDADGRQFEDTCIALRCDYDAGLLLGVTEEQGTLPVPSEENVSFWWGAMG